ncbi:hypothetical protein VKT23_019109 [Stygiomarasmius scandens]|uniref:Protein kinase domain-containing protein n=1 Tax=Marasmiellus scandens TaxID=2682957 RepID=A0ABR1IP06_9AGAR
MELDFFILEQPVQCTDSRGNPLTQLIAGDIKRFENGAAMNQVQVIRMFHFNNIITKILEGETGYTNIMIRRKNQVASRAPQDELYQLTRLIVQSPSPKWDEQQILNNITLSRFLDANSERDRKLHRPIERFIAKLKAKRVVPASIHDATDEIVRHGYNYAKMLLGDDWDKFYQEEPLPSAQRIPSASQPETSSQLSLITPWSTLPLTHVSFLELSGIINLYLVMTSLTEYHGSTTSKSSSHLTTSFCSHITSLALSIDWAQRTGHKPQWRYAQGAESGLKIIFQDPSNSINDYSPMPDFNLRSAEGYLSPFIGEIDSNIREQDRWRMVANSIVIARVGCLVYPDGVGPNKDPFIVTSMFVGKNMSVEIYWTYATRSPDGMVKTYIYHEHYDMKPNRCALLLNIMCFNLREYWSHVQSDKPMANRISGFLKSLKEVLKEDKRNSGNSSWRTGPVQGGSGAVAGSTLNATAPGMTESIESPPGSECSSAGSDSNSPFESVSGDSSSDESDDLTPPSKLPRINIATSGPDTSRTFELVSGDSSSDESDVLTPSFKPPNTNIVTPGFPSSERLSSPDTSKPFESVSVCSSSDESIKFAPGSSNFHPECLSSSSDANSLFELRSSDDLSQPLNPPDTPSLLSYDLPSCFYRICERSDDPALPSKGEILSQIEGEVPSILKVFQADDDRFLKATNYPVEVLRHFKIPSESTRSGFTHDGYYKLAPRFYHGNETTIAVQVLQCVDVLHDLNIVHLEIEISHFLWNPETKHVKLCNFGSARLQEDHSATLSGSFGTPGLTIPEMGFGPFNPYEADNWATGFALSGILNDVPDDQPGPALFLKIQAWRAMRERVEPRQILEEFRKLYTF